MEPSAEAPSQEPRSEQFSALVRAAALPSAVVAAPLVEVKQEPTEPKKIISIYSQLIARGDALAQGRPVPHGVVAPLRHPPQRKAGEPIKGSQSSSPSARALPSSGGPAAENLEDSEAWERTLEQLGCNVDDPEAGSAPVGASSVAAPAAAAVPKSAAGLPNAAAEQARCSTVL
jgi:hypothetical protein